MTISPILRQEQERALLILRYPYCFCGVHILNWVLCPPWTHEIILPLHLALIPLPLLALQYCCGFISFFLLHVQLLVAGSPQLAALSVGGAVGYPGVLLHQLRSNDSTIHLDLDTASWLGSLHGLAGIPSILMPVIMQWKGRKFAFIVACSIILTGWVLAYFATNILQLLFSEFFHGLGSSSILAVSMSSMGEMVTPKYRNISLLSFSIVQALGMALVGITSQYLHWKIISIVMGIPIIIALIITFSWPESPSWLACKGEFDKCELAFKRLRGSDDITMKELEELISSQKEVLRSNQFKVTNTSIKRFWRTITSKDFYLPSIHILVLLNAMYWCGVMVFLIYSTDIIERITTNNNAVFTGSIVTKIILFVGFVVTGFLIRRFNNKPVLLLSILGTAVCLICAFVAIYMQSVGVLRKDSMVCFYCLIAYMVCSSLGLNSIVFTVSAELMPVKHRGLGGALYVIYLCILHTTSLKLAPYLFLYIEMWGTFLVYALNAILCGLLIWKYVPETKGRTLQEIEHFYMYGKFVRTRINKNNEPVDLVKEPKV